ncbi:hypothetical protein JW911_03255 [Candidatus Peregrinibacteria bacterium]|nr:hypothetical protein [Candidatus Peregrinibacteria bacterium]
MKKISALIIGGLLISALFFVAGCSGGEDAAETQTQQTVQEKHIGILKSLGGMSIGEGTHFLETELSGTIRLKSQNINLDSEKYLNKKVEVRGVITKATDGKDLMDVKSIDLAEEIIKEKPSTPGTASEYQNANLGFKLTYLDNWTTKEETNTVTFSAPKPASQEEQPAALETDMVVVTRYSNPSRDTVEKFLNLPTDPLLIVNSGYIQTKVGPDQLEGLKKQSADQNEIDVYLSRNEYIYKISFKGSASIDLINNRNTYFSIIATFQFIGFAPADAPVDAPAAATLPEQKTEPPVVNDSPSITQTASDTPIVTTDSSYGVVSQYIAQSINNIAPEAASSGSWSAYSFEFAKPNYVYVVYGSGTEKRRVLLTYNQQATQLETSVVGYFKPGETTSWTRVSGENPVESAEKTVITLSSSGTQQEAVVKEGYRYFESSLYKFQAQYPSSWYYSGSGGLGDTLHHYGFSNQPVEDGNELVSIDIVTGSVPSGSTLSLGSNQGVKVVTDGQTAVYIQAENGKIYKIHGPTANDAYIMDIAASIQLK